MVKIAACLLFFLVFVQFVFCSTTSEKEHTYAWNKEIPLYANKVGPYDNPDESYPFYALDIFCQPDSVQIKDQNLGEDLEGDTKSVSVFVLPFGKSFPPTIACEKKNIDIKKLKEMIKRNFYYEFVYDDIPIYGFVGKYQYNFDENVLVERTYLYTHYKFTILYNNGGVTNGSGVVIYANLTRDLDKVVAISEYTSTSIKFEYSATWVPVTIEFGERDTVYKDHSFTDLQLKTEMEIHWLSIINSFVLVLLLTAFVALILVKILNRDYIRYSSEDQDEAEYGWKLVASDVFRFPPLTNLFCALVGVGSQFVIMVFFILVLALVGVYHPGNDGAIYVSALVLYALTSMVSGFVSSYWYKKMEGPQWPWNIIVTSSVFSLPFLLMAFFVNVVAVVHHVTKALPFTTILTVLMIWGFVGVPLTLIGGIAGKNIAGPFKSPVRTKNFLREIPYIPWYRRLPVQMIMGGFLPFSAIYVELHYIFHSVWGRGFYQLWGILFLVYIILLLVTLTTTIALTYFQLSMEDYRWWWASFLSGGSTGLFVFFYSIFYYVFRSRMTGFLQASFYFGYQGFICYFFFLMLGSVGFFSAYIFVKRIYKNLHTD